MRQEKFKMERPNLVQPGQKTRPVDSLSLLNLKNKPDKSSKPSFLRSDISIPETHVFRID